MGFAGPNPPAPRPRENEPSNPPRPSNAACRRGDPPEKKCPTSNPSLKEKTKSGPSRRMLSSFLNSRRPGRHSTEQSRPAQGRAGPRAEPHPPEYRPGLRLGVVLLLQNPGDLFLRREFAQVVEPEIDQEVFGGLVEQGAARRFFPAADLDQFFLEQGVQSEG